MILAIRSGLFALAGIATFALCKSSLSSTTLSALLCDCE